MSPAWLRTLKKPILCSFMGLVDVSDGIAYLEQHNFPNYVFPEDAARTMAAMIKYSENMKPHKAETTGGLPSS